MARIRFDVSASDPEKATRRFAGSPRPGMYIAVVDQVNDVFAKDQDRGGRPDKSRPQLEIVYEIQRAAKPKNEKFKGSNLYSYIAYGDNENAEKMTWKLDQFLQAVGLATKTKRKGLLDTSKIEGTKVIIVVRGGTAQDGKSYRGELGQVMAYDAEAWKVAKAEDAEDEDEDLGDEVDEDEEVEFDGDEEENGEEEEEEEEGEEEGDEEESDEEEDEEAEEGDEDEAEGDDEEEEEEEGDEEEEEEEEEEPPAPRRRTRAKATTSRRAPAKKSTAKRATTRRATSTRAKSTSRAKATTARRGKKDDGFPF